MYTSYRRTFTAAGLALISTVVAADDLLVLDTEQKAAAGVSAALFTSHGVLHPNIWFTGNVHIYLDRALNIVRAATTPADLMATPGGVVIDCAIAGTVRARMADRVPRVLRLKWDGCLMAEYGLERTHNGSMAITLTSDTFEPLKVASIRLGDATADFVERYREEMPQAIGNTTQFNNVTLRGDIATNRAYIGPGTSIASSYTMNGHVDQQRSIEFSDGRPAAFVGSKVIAEKTRVRESTIMSESGTVYDRQVLWLHGSWTDIQTELPTFGVTTQRYAFDHYGIHKIDDYEAWSSQLFVDGKIDITWNPRFGSGCMDGPYSFKTRAALVSGLGAVKLDSGHLVVNHSVAARFYSPANVPPTLPVPVNGMLLRMQVQNLGVFNYDVASTAEALTPIAQCTL